MTFADASTDAPPLETIIHGMFRFDEAGLIALLYLSPYDAGAVNTFLT